MTTETLLFDGNRWEKEKQKNLNDADIVFIFGDRETMKRSDIYTPLLTLYPNATLTGSSSSGNILGESLRDEKLVATAIKFDSSHVKVVHEDFEEEDDISHIGNQLVDKLSKEGLKHVFILSDGLTINGSDLAKGANQVLGSTVSVTGGLAGDGTDFAETVVMTESNAKSHRIVAVGFYGESLTIESGCYAGWDEFGVLRKITKSKDNILYEIDDKPALELYKRYLGEHAKNLPSSALDFPMSIKSSKESQAIIRTVLAVDEESQSLIFAGDVPEGYYARLMKTNIDGLIDGAETAANQIKPINDKEALGLVVSCVGRHLVLKQLTDEELESVQDALGEHVQLIGFYSFGELAPFSDQLQNCHLHNQTMTLTVIYED